VRHAELAFWAGDHLIKIPPFPTFSFFCSGIWAWDARQGKMCGGVIASPIFFLASYWIDRRTDVLLSSSSSSTTFFVFTTSRARVRAAFSFSNSSSLSFATLASTKCFLFSLYGPAWMGITWHYYSQVEKKGLVCLHRRLFPQPSSPPPVVFFDTSSRKKVARLVGQFFKPLQFFHLFFFFFPGKKGRKKKRVIIGID